MESLCGPTVEGTSAANTLSQLVYCSLSGASSSAQCGCCTNTEMPGNAWIFIVALLYIGSNLKELTYTAKAIL